ncbi:MAG: gliding motility protein GldN [Bacteroidales bacterium]|jgi:gliding motility associated protien GldN|nr:gliding motility protein GldN [Bacteroidales bacterium]
MNKSIYKFFSIVALSLSVSITSAQLISGSTQNTINTPRDNIFEEIHVQFKKPVPYPPLRQADVIYKKRIWQKIDFREKMNQPFYYPIEAHVAWKSFMSTILDALRAGELTAYDDRVDDEFTTPLTWRELEYRLSGQPDSIDQFDQYGLLIGKKISFPDQYQEGEVKVLKLKEVWYFDKQRSQMMVRILGLGPVREFIDSETQEKREQTLFWIYFPDARPILAKALVFNRNNSGARLTYDDVFWKRFFDSYIYKVENVYDREISQYAIGMDALLESDRFKKEIFDMEQSLWEY